MDTKYKKLLELIDKKDKYPNVCSLETTYK